MSHLCHSTVCVVLASSTSALGFSWAPFLPGVQYQPQSCSGAAGSAEPSEDGFCRLFRLNLRCCRQNLDTAVAIFTPLFPFLNGTPVLTFNKEGGQIQVLAQFRSRGASVWDLKAAFRSQMVWKSSLHLAPGCFFAPTFYSWCHLSDL